MEKLTSEFTNLTLSQKPISSNLRTGLIYHEDMLKHALSLTNDQKANSHPENPTRLRTVIDLVQSSDVKDNIDIVTEFEEAERELITLTHSEDYYDYINDIYMFAGNKESMKYKDTYYNKHTVRAAKLAANALKICVDRVLGSGKQNWANAFAAVRPPGHHAAAGNRCSGFCFFNNIAVGANYAMEKYGLKRVAIFDWDVHHGDSTQRIFEGNPNVLFISFHRYDGGAFFPRTGDLDKVGTKGAEGFNLNLPWNPQRQNDYKYIDDNEYIYAFERLAFPILKEFDPELIFISSGFDCHKGDTLGGFEVTQDGLCYIANRLRSLAGGKVIAALEGGYNHKVTSRGVEALLRTFSGETMPHKSSRTGRSMDQLLSQVSPSLINIEDVDKALKVWAKYWPVLQSDQGLLDFEKEVKDRIQSSLYIIQGDPLRTTFQLNPLSYTKIEDNKAVITFYRRHHSRIQSISFLPTVANVTPQSDKTLVSLPDWSNGSKEGYHYLKLTLFPREKTMLERDTESETSTELENPIFLEYFTVKGGLIILEDGELIFIERNSPRKDQRFYSRKSIMRIVNPNQMDSFLHELRTIKQYVNNKSTEFAQLRFSLVLTKFGDDKELRVILTNPEFDEDADHQDIILALDELIGLMKEKPE